MNGDTPPVPPPPTRESCSEAAAMAGPNPQTASPTPGDGIVEIKNAGFQLHCKPGETMLFPIEQQNAFYSSRFFGVDKVLADLHYTCYSAGAPRFLVDKIMDILRASKKDGFRIDHPMITKRESLMKRLQLSLNSPPPEAINVNLESGLKTTILRFDLMDRMQRHLSGPTYAEYPTHPQGTPHTSPFGAIEISQPQYSCFTSSNWYRDALKMYAPLLATGEYILHPLIGYMDKTGVDSSIEKNSLEPVAVTSAILPQAEREKVENWILLGYIPSLKWLRQQKSKTTT